MHLPEGVFLIFSIPTPVSQIFTGWSQCRVFTSPNNSRKVLICCLIGFQCDARAVHNFDRFFDISILMNEVGVALIKIKTNTNLIYLTTRWQIFEFSVTSPSFGIPLLLVFLPTFAKHRIAQEDLDLFLLQPFLSN